MFSPIASDANTPSTPDMFVLDVETCDLRVPFPDMSNSANRRGTSVVVCHADGIRRAIELTQHHPMDTYADVVLLVLDAVEALDLHGPQSEYFPRRMLDVLDVAALTTVPLEIGCLHGVFPEFPDPDMSMSLGDLTARRLQDIFESSQALDMMERKASQPQPLFVFDRKDRKSWDSPYGPTPRGRKR